MRREGGGGGGVRVLGVLCGCSDKYRNVQIKLTF